MRKILLSFLACLLVATPVFAVNLTEDQKGVISVGCGTIKTSLKSLQRSDAATRAHFGTTYQTIFANYLTPLNLRLVKNGSLSTDLNSLQNDYTTRREWFNNDYIEYSRSLEELISLDCQSEPEAFYDKLSETRELRAKVTFDITEMNHILNKHLAAVEALKNVK